MSGGPPRGGARSCSEYAMAQDYNVNIKVKGLGEAARQLSDFVDELNEAREAGSSVSGALDQATGGAVTGFRKAASGVKTFIAGLKMTRAAIIATGIGALVVGVTALVSAFGKTEAGARKLKVVMAGLSAGIEFFTVRIQAAGGYLVNLFTKGHTAAAEEFNKALKDVDATLDGAISQAVRLEKAQQALIDRQIEMTKRRAEDRKDIKEYNMVAEDTTKSLEEREAAAKSAIEIEKALMAERLSIAQKEAEIHAERMSMGASTEEDRMKQAELEAQVMDLQTESLELQTTLNNKLNTIRNEAARVAEEEAKRIADAAAEKKKAEEEAAAAIAAAEQQVIDALAAARLAREDQRTQEEAAAKAAYTKRIELAGENAELIAQIEEEYRLTLMDIDDKYQAQARAKEEEAATKRAEIEKATTEFLAEQRRTAREQELTDLEADYSARIMAVADNADLVAQLEAQFLEARREMYERHYDEDQKANQENNEKKYEQDKQSEEARAALKEQAMSATFDVLRNLTAAAEKDTEESAKKAFKRNKAVSIAETLVNTYMAAQKAYTSQIIPGDPTSIVRAQIAAGIAVAAGLAKVAAIKSTQFNAGGGGAAAGGSAGGIGGGTQSVGVDVGTLIPTQQTPTPEPVRAYVVENEISNKQALNRELQIQTTL